MHISPFLKLGISGGITFAIATCNIGSTQAAPRSREDSTAKGQDPAVAALKFPGLSSGISNCSRVTPSSIGLWEVPEKEVVLIDKALIRFLRSNGKKIDLPFLITEYVRQYIGLQRNESRVVYINALHVKQKRSSILRKINNEFLRLCDGGGEAWGIEYDPKTKTFGKFETNSE